MILLNLIVIAYKVQSLEHLKMFSIHKQKKKMFTRQHCEYISIARKISFKIEIDDKNICTLQDLQFIWILVHSRNVTVQLFWV